MAGDWQASSRNGSTAPAHDAEPSGPPAAHASPRAVSSEGGSPTAIRVERIETIEGFAALRTDWERAYAADANAHIFVSWPWLRAWFELVPYRWAVLAARPEGSPQYTGFLPLIERGPGLPGFPPVCTLQMGGRPLACYTGFVGAPAFEKDAIAAIASHLERDRSWQRLQLEGVLDPRVELFLERFSPDGYSVRKSPGMPSLYLSLPSSWEAFLENFHGPRTRHRLARSLARARDGPLFGIRAAAGSAAGDDLDMLLAMWQRRWGPKPAAPYHRAMLRCCLENGIATLRVMADGGRTVASYAALLDRTRRTFILYIMSHDPAYARFSPGRTMVADAIRYAIEEGFERFDFLVGADAYKIWFGARQRPTLTAVVRRGGIRGMAANGIVEGAAAVSGWARAILGRAKRTRLVRELWFRVRRFGR